MKSKDITGDQDVAVTVANSRPLAGFTRPSTPLECRIVQTYHHFKVPKKGQAKTLIIFHALGDIDKRIKQCEESNTNTNCGIQNG